MVVVNGWKRPGHRGKQFHLSLPEFKALPSRDSIQARLGVEDHGLRRKKAMLPTGSTA